MVLYKIQDKIYLLHMEKLTPPVGFSDLYLICAADIKKKKNIVFVCILYLGRSRNCDEQNFFQMNRIFTP